MDSHRDIAYLLGMAVPEALLEQLLQLDERSRFELAQALLLTVDGEGDQGDAEDDLDDADRARLHAALERSREDVKAGRVHDAGEILAELAARARR